MEYNDRQHSPSAIHNPYYFELHSYIGDKIMTHDFAYAIDDTSISRRRKAFVVGKAVVVLSSRADALM